jgi:hypothetical protein
LFILIASSVFVLVYECFAFLFGELMTLGKTARAEIGYMPLFATMEIPDSKALAAS